MDKRNKNWSSSLDDSNPKYWKGIFYVNRKDKRMVVPKQKPAYGMTLNFGNPYTYVLLVLFFGVLIAYSIFF